MTQNDLFEWAEQLYSKYGIKEKQLELPLSEPEKKETKVIIFQEDDGYCD